MKNISMQHSEVWKPIPGYGDFYEASNLGRIRSIDRVVFMGPVGDCLKKGRILKQKSCKNDSYLRVRMSDGLRPYTPLVHRLIALAFIENPDDKRTVNHKNGVKTDNYISNLEWATHSENSQHAHNTGLLSSPKGVKHFAAKLSEKQVLEIRNLTLERRLTNIQIGSLYGVKKSTINAISQRLTWKHI